MDTMTLTKLTASVCAGMLVLLLGTWAGEALYHVELEGEQSYVIDTGEDEEAAEEEVAAVPFEEVYASADASRGERVFRQCAACHRLEDGANGTGPHLYGVVGRSIGAVDGFGYSGTLADMGGDWTPENLNGFLEAPREWAPGTSMGYSGLDDVEDRANIIAYLETFGG